MIWLQGQGSSFLVLVLFGWPYDLLQHRHYHHQLISIFGPKEKFTQNLLSSDGQCRGATTMAWRCLGERTAFQGVSKGQFEIIQIIHIWFFFLICYEVTNRPTTVGQTDTDGILREEWWFRPNFQILLPRINFLLTLIFSSLGSKLLILKRNVCDAIRQPSISDLCKLTNTAALLWRDLKGSKLGSTNVATYVSQLPHKTVFPPNLFTCQKMAVKNA